MAETKTYNRVRPGCVCVNQAQHASPEPCRARAAETNFFLCDRLYANSPTILPYHSPRMSASEDILKVYAVRNPASAE